MRATRPPAPRGAALLGSRAADAVRADAGRSAESLRIVVADDHPFYRRGLVRILTSVGIDVVAQAANGAAAIRAAVELAPDVVVMDLNMPGVTGFDATRKLAELAPASPVLVLSVSAQEADVVDAIIAGARGYVLKDAPIGEVIAGIQAVAAGQSLISPRVALTLLERIRGQTASASALTVRELEVLTLLGAGKSTAEIGATLALAHGSVRNHLTSILMKLQVENRVQAAVRALRDRMV